MNQGRVGWEAGWEVRGGPGAGQVCWGPGFSALVRVPPALTPVMGPQLDSGVSPTLLSGPQWGSVS